MIATTPTTTTDSPPMWRGLALFVALPLGLVILWIVAGVLGALIPGQVARHDGPDLVQIGLIATPIHYDLLLPITPELQSRFGFAAADGVGITAPDAGWLLIGWGAHEFYTSAGGYSDVPLHAVWRGIVGDASVLRLEAWGQFALADLPEVQPITLTESGYAALLDRIEAEITPPRLLRAPGLTEADAFYHARTGFSALRTCNVWMGETLREAGVPLGAWLPTPQALRLSLWFWGD
ncbi:DUF2459 domain-containing protein [Gemmobacter denitrificans]|uniref:DUF2459 domain-containing protein n=1 Tax=Gemmobacter denitrificans TaxID=3123040 RepID=A0ABU8BU62_9RHOB